MKFAFIGTHGVGKTTLCFELAALLKKRDRIVEMVHEVARFCPLPINRETTTDAQSWILHTEIAEELVAENKAYPCYCTPEELDAERKRLEALKLPPRYSGRCANLTAEQRAAFEAEGREPALRFRVGEGTVVIEDVVRGRVEIDVR